VPHFSKPPTEVRGHSAHCAAVARHGAACGRSALHAAYAWRHVAVRGSTHCAPRPAAGSNIGCTQAKRTARPRNCSWPRLPSTPSPPAPRARPPALPGRGAEMTKRTRRTRARRRPRWTRLSTRPARCWTSSTKCRVRQSLHARSAARGPAAAGPTMRRRQLPHERVAGTGADDVPGLGQVGPEPSLQWRR
jgi:hypothetical protein